MVSSLHNMSSEEIADEYGEINAQLKAIEARLKDLKAELINRNASNIKGLKFTLSLAEQISARVDVTSMREKLGESFLKEFEKICISSVIRVKNCLPDINYAKQA